MTTARNRPARRPSGPNPALIIGVVIGVLVLATIAVVATSDGDDDADVAIDANGEVIPEYGIITVDGEPLPAAPGPGQPDPAIGAAAPSVISERSGEQIRLEPGEEDQPAMVVFLAHWCPHCQRELPRLVQLREQGAFDGIRTVAVLTGTTEERDNFPPSSWLDREGWTGDRLFDDDESTAASVYGLASYPMLVFLDAEGTVVERLSGEQEPATIQDAVDAATG